MLVIYLTSLFHRVLHGNACPYLREVEQLTHWPCRRLKRQRLNSKEAPRLRFNHPVGMVVLVRGCLRPPLAGGPMETPPKTILRL